MATLTDLLNYKKEIEILHPETGKPLKKVWIRLLGDLDLTASYKKARLASSAKRAALRDENSDDYKDEVVGVVDLSKEEQIDFIKTSRLSQIMAEAQIAVARPDLPQLEEIAIEPDAATLEELERMDEEEKDDEITYTDKIEEYINLRTLELESNLRNMPDEELLTTARFEVSNLIPFTLFITELNDWKAFLGTYQDKACTIKEFGSIEEFKQLPRPVKQFIIEEINSLEVSGNEIKN